MRLLPALFLSATVLGLGFFHSVGKVSAAPIIVEAEAVPLDPQNPELNRVGALIYRGGLLLSSDEGRFGGFSALGVSADGSRMVSLSDRGNRLSANLIYSPDGNLVGIENTDLSSLAGLDGRTLQSKTQSDIEAMSPGVEGEIIVAFERNHRLWQYFPGRTVPQELVAPEGISKLEDNSGIEALTLLNDGRLLAVAEGSQSKANTIGWVSDVSGWSPLTYQTKDGFRVTGAATHTNGDVYFLERYYTLRDGVAVRIRRLAGKSVFPGAELSPSLIAELRPPLHVDNFEGIEVRASADNRTFLYVISDDNFNMLQSTLLMMFEVQSP